MTPSFVLSLRVIELSFRVWYNEVTQYYNHVIKSVSSANPDGPAAPATRGQPWSQEEAMEEMAGDPTRDAVPERVVQATIRLLAEQGPSAIKARTVASASGLSTMAVYHHFGGIAELI